MVKDLFCFEKLFSKKCISVKLLLKNGPSSHIFCALFRVLCIVTTNRYLGYHKDEDFAAQGQNGVQELWLSFFALTESILLASFAAILAAHRSEILEKPGGHLEETETVTTYDAPSTLV